MHDLILHLGSNMGRRNHHLQAACYLLSSKVGKIYRRSAVYETAAWGMTEQADFLNIAVWIKTVLPPAQVLAQTQAIEHILHRERLVHWGPRTIDIDLMFYDQLIMTDPQLTLPHPRIAQRHFVLRPLVDICPDWVHPLQHLPIVQLLRKCPDTSAVTRVSGLF